MLNAEQMRAFTLAIVILGVIVLIAAAFIYFNASAQLATNAMQQRLQSETPPEAQTGAEGAVLLAAGAARQRLLQQQGVGIALAGIGVVLVAGGYLVGDVLAGRRRKANQNPA
jgi:drug/metabolite transporter (DMT)-like permease